MLKFVLLSIVFLVQLQSKEYRLEYGFEVGQKLKYDFSGSHKARFITYDNIQTAEEKLIGFYEDEVMEITSDVQAKILRKFRIASRQHNGDFKDLNDLASKNLKYIYYLDPQKGKVKVLDSSTEFPKVLNEDSKVILDDKKNNSTIKKVKVLIFLILLFLIILFIGLYVR